MRVQLQNNPIASIFTKRLLEVGNNTVPTDTETEKIAFSSNLYNIVNSKEELVHKVFQSIETNDKNHAYLSERAILVTKNVDVHDMNIILNKIAGKTNRDIQIY